MKQKIWIPITVGLFLLTLFSLMALTDLFLPVIAFIHSQEITPLQAVSCVLGVLLCFYATYNVLVKLGAYFLPKE